MKNGKAKGDRFENDMCRVLSEWLIASPAGVDWKKAPMQDLPFRRRFTEGTPLEGHWNGRGDILHRPGIKFPFCVECKKIEGWELDGMFTSEKWLPWAWWEQCKGQARDAGLVPLMLFTRNRREVYCLLPEEIGQCLKVQPKHGPNLQVERPDGEVLLLTVLRNLTSVPSRNLTRLKS